MSDRLLFLRVIIIKSTGFVQLSEWLLNFDAKLMVFSQKKAGKANIGWITKSFKLSGKKYLSRKLTVEFATQLQESQKMGEGKISFQIESTDFCKFLTKN